MNLVNVDTSSVRKDVLLNKLKDKALPLHDMKVLEGRVGAIPSCRVVGELCLLTY
jgi:hypothetical protein